MARTAKQAGHQHQRQCGAELSRPQRLRAGTALQIGKPGHERRAGRDKNKRSSQESRGLGIKRAGPLDLLVSKLPRSITQELHIRAVLRAVGHANRIACTSVCFVLSATARRRDVLVTRCTAFAQVRPSVEPTRHHCFSSRAGADRTTGLAAERAQGRGSTRRTAIDAIRVRRLDASYVAEAVLSSETLGQAKLASRRWARPAAMGGTAMPSQRSSPRDSGIRARVQLGRRQLADRSAAVEVARDATAAPAPAGSRSDARRSLPEPCWLSIACMRRGTRPRRTVFETRCRAEAASVATRTAASRLRVITAGQLDDPGREAGLERMRRSAPSPDQTDHACRAKPEAA